MSETREQRVQRIQSKYDAYRNALVDSSKQIEAAIMAIALDVKCDADETEKIKFAYGAFIDVFMYKVALKLESNEGVTFKLESPCNNPQEEKMITQ